MSDKLEELNKLMALYKSGAINENEMILLKKQILNLESSSEKEKVEENNIETPKDISIVKTSNLPKTEKKIAKTEVTKNVNSINEKTNKLDTLLKEGKISENEHKILVAKTLKLEEIPIPVIEKPKVPAPPPPIPPKLRKEIKIDNQPKIVLKSKSQDEDKKGIKLVAQKETVTTEINKEEPPHTLAAKKKNWTVLYIIIAFAIIGGSILTYFLMTNGSSENKDNASNYSQTPTISKYVMSGSLNLTKEPNEDSDVLHVYSFGSEVKFIENTEKSSGNHTYMQAIYNDTKGWVSVKFRDINLISDRNKIDAVENIVSGPYASEKLESMGATAKLVILDLCNEGDKIDINSSDFPSIQFFRSRTKNRNSTSDKKKEINDQPKDMVFCVNKASGEQWMYMIYFDNNYNYTVALETKVWYDKIIGFERIKRHQVLNFQSDYEYFEDYELTSDAVKVLYQNDSYRYYYPTNGLHSWYEPTYMF